MWSYEYPFTIRAYTRNEKNRYNTFWIVIYCQRHINASSTFETLHLNKQMYLFQMIEKLRKRGYWTFFFEVWFVTWSFLFDTVKLKRILSTVKFMWLEIMETCNAPDVAQTTDLHNKEILTLYILEKVIEWYNFSFFIWNHIGSRQTISIDIFNCMTWGKRQTFQ